MRTSPSTNPTDQRLLKPSAREVFDLRPRHEESREVKRSFRVGGRRNGATTRWSSNTVKVTVTDPWPNGMTAQDLQGALVQTGYRR
jgi:hypothetical protein